MLSNKITQILLIIWAAIVFTAYIYFHNYISIILGVGLILIIFWIFNILLRKFLKIKNILLLVEGKKIYLWQVFLILICSSASVIYIFYFIHNYSSLINISDLFNTLIYIFFTVALYSSLLLLFVFFTAGVGSWLNKIFKFRFENKIQEFIFGFAISVMTQSYIVFLLAWTKNLYFWWFFIIVVIFILVAHKYIYKYVLIFVKYIYILPKSYKDEDSVSKPIILFLFLLFFSSILLINTFRYFPLHVDDISVYHALPELYVSTHQLLSFHNSITASAAGISTVFQSGWILLLGSRFVFMFSFLFLSMLILCVYEFAKEHHSKKAALVAVWMTILTPWHSVFVITQKVDLILAFFSLAAVFLFYKWFKDRSRIKFLYLSAAFLGFVISIKFSGFFILLPLVFIVVVYFLLGKIKWKEIFLFGLILLLFFAPLAIFNIVNYKNPIAPYNPFRKPNAENMFLSGGKVTMLDLHYKSILMSKENDLITQGTRQSSYFNNPVLDFFWEIWNLTVNQKGMKHVLIQPGIIFLIFLPFLIIYFWLGKMYRYREERFLYFVFFSGAILWYFEAYLRTWYAMSFFYIYYILASAYFIEVVKKTSKKFLNTIYIILAVLIIFINLAMIDSVSNLLLAGGYSSKKFTDWYAIAQVVNKEIAKNPDSLILILPGQYISYIDRADKHMIASSYGFYWSQIVFDANYSFENINKILKEQEITHILYMYGSEEWILENAPASSDFSLFKSYDLFYDFKDKYLTKIDCIQKNCIYKVK